MFWMLIGTSARETHVILGPAVLGSNGTLAYAYVSSRTVYETTSEPDPKKEPEPRNNHPESVETSILYRYTVLGA